MDAQQRRQIIARRLADSEGPLSAAVLARELSVSRQIIVGDVALLRAGGLEITATPRGYLLPKLPAGVICTVACRHREDHPIYGQLTGPLRLSNRYEVAQFVARCHQETAVPLSQLTEGIHLHTLSCPGWDAADRVRRVLKRLGFLYQ